MNKTKGKTFFFDYAVGCGSLGESWRTKTTKTTKKNMKV